MKKIFLTILLLSESAFSASPTALKAVLDLAEVKALASIETLHVQKSFRCQECHEVCVHGLKSATDQKLTDLLIKTRYDQQKQEVVAEVIQK